MASRCGTGEQSSKHLESKWNAMKCWCFSIRVMTIIDRYWRCCFYFSLNLDVRSDIISLMMYFFVFFSSFWFYLSSSSFTCSAFEFLICFSSFHFRIYEAMARRTRKKRAREKEFDPSEINSCHKSFNLWCTYNSAKVFDGKPDYSHSSIFSSYDLSLSLSFARHTTVCHLKTDRSSSSSLSQLLTFLILYDLKAELSMFSE